MIVDIHGTRRSTAGIHKRYLQKRWALSLNLVWCNKTRVNEKSGSEGEETYVEPPELQKWSRMQTWDLFVMNILLLHNATTVV